MNATFNYKLKFQQRINGATTMTDVFSKEKRSDVMSKIRGKNTKPEIIVRKFLFSNGLRYRLHSHQLPGSPDIVLRKYKTVIFVNGCFWHRHEGCKIARLPETRTDYWVKKFNSNCDRDSANIALLTSLNWKVLVIWECQLAKSKRQDSLFKLLNELRDVS